MAATGSSGALALSPFVGQTLKTFVSKENHEDMLVLRSSSKPGKVTPVIDRTLPARGGARGDPLREEGRARGKVVIDVDG